MIGKYLQLYLSLTGFHVGKAGDFFYANKYYGAALFNFINKNTPKQTTNSFQFAF